MLSCMHAGACGPVSVAAVAVVVAKSSAAHQQQHTRLCALHIALRACAGSITCGAKTKCVTPRRHAPADVGGPAYRSGHEKVFVRVFCPEAPPPVLPGGVLCAMQAAR